MLMVTQSRVNCKLVKDPKAGWTVDGHPERVELLMSYWPPKVGRTVNVFSEQCGLVMDTQSRMDYVNGPQK